MALHVHYEGVRTPDDGALKQCRGCLTTKPLADFPPDRRAPDGKQARCRACINGWMQKHYRRNPGWAMFRRAKARAAKKGWDFDLTIDDILPLPTHCPVFGMPLTLHDVGSNPWSPSLDRINNSRGYVRDNVVVMSYLANRLKNDGTAAQHEAIAKWMRANSLG